MESGPSGQNNSNGGQQVQGDTTLELSDLSVILSTLFEDMEQIRARRKDKRREDSDPDDEELALRAFEEEMESLTSFMQDFHFARSINSALETDGPILEQLASVETQIQADHDLARRLQTGRTIQATATTAQGSAINTSHLRDNVPSSSSHATLAVCFPSFYSFNDSSYRSRCVVCDDDAAGAKGLLFPCKDAYDIKCAIELFQHAMRDESLMPPRCCRMEIPAGQVLPYLRQQEREIFMEKRQEYSTLNRLYCPRATCSKFMGSCEGEVRNVTCPACRLLVCTGCKKNGHASHIPCDNDNEAQQLLELGERNGWQRCPGCHRMVELALGCYHMTCLCRTEFCYLCRARWKNCGCAQWDEHRLLVAARQRVANENADRPAMPAAERARQVRVAADHLRTNHECNHPSWYLRHGRDQCENCYKWLDRYLLCCRGCQMRACVRCQRNRL
ncbi:hypothetical protein M422DRAFT_151942 [Sphaerobolus stellatus SS14]|nr:hypothetical protein M422DRAFT_151942 [Sphaerobolus stellatus SS14]